MMDKSIENIMDDVEKDMESMSAESIHTELIKNGQTLCANENLHLYGISKNTDLESIMDDIQNESEMMSNVYIEKELRNSETRVYSEEDLYELGVVERMPRISLKNKVKSTILSIFGTNDRFQGFAVGTISAFSIAIFSWNSHTLMYADSSSAIDALEEEKMALMARIADMEYALENRIIAPNTRVVPSDISPIREAIYEAYGDIPASSIGQESYYLQVGGIKNLQNAKEKMKLLQLIGLDSFIVTRQEIENTKRYHLLRIGPFFDLDSMLGTKKRLKDSSIEYVIVKVTG